MYLFLVTSQHNKKEPEKASLLRVPGRQRLSQDFKVIGERSFFAQDAVDKHNLLICLRNVLAENGEADKPIRQKDRLVNFDAECRYRRARNFLQLMVKR